MLLFLFNIKSSPHSLDNRTPCYFPLDPEQGEEGAEEREAVNQADRTRWQWVPTEGTGVPLSPGVNPAPITSTYGKPDSLPPSTISTGASFT